ncbi:MAG: chromate transporter, chromate ion transporter family [Dehalococcoidia bacterium]|nr:chromate transporter, chromate ion transporter family [Dehalococcoidia bacterium]
MNTEERGTKQAVKFSEALRFWVRLGFINFGGPAGQIAIMHSELVDKRRWISEEQYLRALNFCMILPGPEAQQLATYVGWRLHGFWGGVVAGSFFVIPSIFVMIGLSWLAVAQTEVPAISWMFYGIQPVVLGIVAEAIIRIGRRSLRHRVMATFPIAAFIAIFFLSVPFPLVIAGAALGGLALHRFRPEVFAPAGHGAEAQPHTGGRIEVVYPPFTRALRVGAVFLLLWAVPVGGLWLWRGGSDVLVQEALFFTQSAFITIGGAYAVLSYIADVAVNSYGWLDTGQMVQGLGLAESTPGPLIMVTQYVGFLGAWRLHGAFDPLLYGVLGSLITTYVTFLPSFLFIFAGAPYIEALAGNRRLQAALAGVTAAIVGVILNLAVYFSSHVLFPSNGGMDIYALVTAMLSFILLWRFHLPIHLIVPAGAITGLVWSLLTKGVGL